MVVDSEPPSAGLLDTPKNVGCAKQSFGKRNIAEKISERNIFLKPKQYFISGQSWLFKQMDDRQNKGK